MRRCIALIALGHLSLMAPLATAVAQDDDLAALDAKIANLENRNATLKKRVRLEALEKGNAALRKQLGIANDYQSLPNERPSIVSEQRVAAIGPATFDSRVPASKTVASDYARGGASRPEIPDARAAYAMKTPPNPNGPEVVLVPPPPPPPVWGGFYAGASFGLGRLHARELDNGVNAFNFINTSSSTFQNAFSFGSSQFTSQTTSLSANSANMSGAQSGGIANLSLGFNWMLVGNFVSGVQIEGGLSNIQARLTGIGMSTSTGTGFTTSTFTSTSICPTCIPPNPTTSSTGTFTSPPTIGSGTQSVVDTLASRWFVSALARGGFLIDPIDLVYVIGGWTYAGFETPQNSSQFGLHGATIGAGVERQISSFWVIKAEYRYTKFQSKTIDLPSISISNSSSSSNDGQGNTSSATSVSTSYGNNSASFSPDMHVVYIGIARYF